MSFKDDTFFSDVCMQVCFCAGTLQQHNATQGLLYSAPPQLNRKNQHREHRSRDNHYRDANAYIQIHTGTRLTRDGCVRCFQSLAISKMLRVRRENTRQVIRVKTSCPLN